MNYIIALIAVAVLLIFGLAWFNESQATRIQAQAQAQAVIIRAESDARFKDAQSSTLMMAAMIPMALIVAFGIVGSIAALALVVWVWKRQPAQPPMLERQIIYVLPPGQPRRELWQAISNTRQLQPIRGRDEINIR